MKHHRYQFRWESSLLLILGLLAQGCNGSTTVPSSASPQAESGKPTGENPIPPMLFPPISIQTDAMPVGVANTPPGQPPVPPAPMAPLTAPPANPQADPSTSLVTSPSVPPPFTPPVDPASGPPRITGINPKSGNFGQKIRLTGVNLGQVQKVLFAVELVSREAEFRTVNNTELEVTAPEFYSPEPELVAAILVLNSRGIAVTCPASADVVRDSVGQLKSTFVHVLDGGVLEKARAITVIEDGGMVSQAENAPWVFVRARGTLGRAQAIGTLFHEPGARLGPSISGPGADGVARSIGCSLMPVAEISLGEGVGPFQYLLDSTTAALASAKQPPTITSVSPTQVKPGDIVTLTGSGFTGTKEVWVSGDHRSPHLAGSRVISDEKLKFEVPSMIHCKFSVTVVNQRGATIAASQEIVQHPGDPAAKSQSGRARLYPLIWVRDGEVVEEREACTYFVDQGGTVLKAGGGTLFLVKSGGTFLGTTNGQVIYEVGARVTQDKVPERSKSSKSSLTKVPGAKHIQRVGSVTLNILQESLEVSP
jgi:hypothetical protein